MNSENQVRTWHATATLIWEALVEHCGAREDKDGWNRLWFVSALEDYLGNPGSWGFEYRFQGSLGFGGKLYHQDHSGFYVSCYPESRTPERDRAIETMNSWLGEKNLGKKG